LLREEEAPPPFFPLISTAKNTLLRTPALPPLFQTIVGLFKSPSVFHHRSLRKLDFFFFFPPQDLVLFLNGVNDHFPFFLNDAHFGGGGPVFSPLDPTIGGFPFTCRCWKMQVFFPSFFPSRGFASPEVMNSFFSLLVCHFFFLQGQRNCLGLRSNILISWASQQFFCS